MKKMMIFTAFCAMVAQAAFGQLAPEPARTDALYEKMASSRPSAAVALVRKALRDDDRRYRFGALSMASGWASAEMYGALIEGLPKMSDAAEADVLNWLYIECTKPERRAQIEPLVGSTVFDALSSGSDEVVEAAAKLLSRTGGERAVEALAGLLARPETVAVGAAALAQTAGDVPSAVVERLGAMGDAGKVAALDLLAERRAEKYADEVFALTGAGSGAGAGSGLGLPSPEVRAAAYAALAGVVSAADAGRLYDLLQVAEGGELAAVQNALAVATEGADGGTALTRMAAEAPEKQYRHYPILAATGGEDALNVVADRFRTESGTAKEAAFDALLAFDDVAAAEKLMAIAEGGATDAAYSDRALDRYTELVAGSALGGEQRRELLVEGLAIARTGTQKSALLRALGQTNSYPGMVRAGEMMDDPDPAVRGVAASAVMKIALDNPSFVGDEVRALLEKVITALDNPDAGYEQQAVRKHLAEMPLLQPFELPADEVEEGFTVLFDGRNLDKWVGNKVDYRVENGTIALYPSREFGGNLYTAREYGNFVYRFEFMLTPGANNGVGIRTPMDVDAAYHGMEIQILDHDDPMYADITTHQVHGSVYGVIGARRAVLRPAGEWNAEEIVADGDHIRVTLNGEVILDGNIREAARGGTFDGLKHPGLFNKRGHIGFLGHGSQLKFRNIRIRELK